MSPDHPVNVGNRPDGLSTGGDINATMGTWLTTVARSATRCSLDLLGGRHQALNVSNVAVVLIVMTGAAGDAEDQLLRPLYVEVARSDADRNQRVQDNFKKIDTDNDGSITVDKLREYHKGDKASAGEVDVIALRYADSDGGIRKIRQVILVAVLSVASGGMLRTSA